MRFTLDAAPGVTYFCADESCGCRVDRLFRSEKEHDEYVRERCVAGGGEGGEGGEVSGNKEGGEVPGSEDEQDMSELPILPESKSATELGMKRSGEFASSASQGPPKRSRSQ